VECGGEDFEQSTTGEWYCAACGVVHSSSEVKFDEPGWTPWEERRTAQAGNPSRLAVGTVVGDVNGASTPRWAQYNKRLRHDRETLRHGLRELRAVSAALEASDSLTEQAATLFRRASEEGLLVGQSLEAMAAACVHATARERQRPFPIKQVAAVSPVECDAVRSAFSKLVREFELRVAPPLPTAFVPRFASEVGLSQEARRRAHQLLEAVVNDDAHVGQSPTGVAAAALYGAAKECGESVTQEELAEVAHVSVVTLSRQWQTVKEYTQESGLSG
jgi:transcription initiation factor TFIIB